VGRGVSVGSGSKGTVFAGVGAGVAVIVEIDVQDGGNARDGLGRMASVEVVHPARRKTTGTDFRRRRDMLATS
jgi:hypothetical protein